MNDFHEVDLTGRLYLTKFTLIKAAMLAEGHGFNRQLKTETLGTLADFNYPVLRVFAHFHKRGEPCAEHRRMEVSLPNPGTDVLIEVANARLMPHTIDVPMDFYRDVCAQCGVKEVEGHHV
jgi:hypothetical protein